jgi:hypothetical protein
MILSQKWTQIAFPIRARPCQRSFHDHRRQDHLVQLELLPDQVAVQMNPLLDQQSDIIQIARLGPHSGSDP